MYEKMNKRAFFELLNERNQEHAVLSLLEAAPMKAPRLDIMLVPKEDQKNKVVVHTVCGPGSFRAGKSYDERLRKFYARCDVELKKFKRWLSEWQEQKHVAG